MLCSSTSPSILLANNQLVIMYWPVQLFNRSDSGVLMAGLILLGFSAIPRAASEGTGWIRRMLLEQSISP